MIALRRAIDADCGFSLALADLEALSGHAVERPSARQMNWELHHIEVVRAASSGEPERAADLLREHLAATGCDPLALRVVTYLRDAPGRDVGLRDLGLPSAILRPGRARRSRVDRRPVENYPQSGGSLPECAESRSGY